MATLESRIKSGGLTIRKKFLNLKNTTCGTWNAQRKVCFY